MTSAPLPNPAIVAQNAVRRLPRWPLMWLCAAYVLAGYLGRQPWKNADITAYAHMLALRDAPGSALWLQAQDGALLPYWLGAWAMQWLQPLGLDAALAARVPFMLLLAGTLAATWHAVYQLCREPGAQPLAFAFGGEAQPADYARALADGGLLALIATLGLAQFSHETTPALAQLFFTALSFYGLAALPRRPRPAALALLLGLPGLSLSGAPLMAVAFALLGLPGLPARHGPRARYAAWGLLLGLAVLCLGLALQGHLLTPPSLPEQPGLKASSSFARLLLWFTWPAWPLALWTLWRWRRQLRQRHLALPLLLAAAPLLAAALDAEGDRNALLALPALAALAALALPTFNRTASALIDWFTLLFFTGWAIVIWVVWLSLKTGFPAKPAANVARLAPGFEPVFQWPAFVAALLGTLAWIALVRWRTGRHRTALWKSLVLPAAGTTLCWLLLMTLWLPALDYARSYAAQLRLVQQALGQPHCVATQGLSAAQQAGLRVHGGWPQVPLHQGGAACPWLLTGHSSPAPDPATWTLVSRVPRPTDKNEHLLLYQRRSTP